MDRSGEQQLTVLSNVGRQKQSGQAAGRKADLHQCCMLISFLTGVLSVAQNVRAAYVTVEGPLCLSHSQCSLRKAQKRQMGV